MLASQYKLNSVEFTTVFTTGKKIHTDSLMITYLSGHECFKAAVVVSKKQTKTAILRNYKRRVIFNALKNVHRDNTENLNGIWMIIMLKKGSLKVPFSQLEKELQQIIGKLL